MIDRSILAEHFTEVCCFRWRAKPSSEGGTGHNTCNINYYSSVPQRKYQTSMCAQLGQTYANALMSPRYNQDLSKFLKMRVYLP